jgi:subtilisin family serine protease
VVETVRAAGIFVVASAGNEGPQCASVQNPIALHDAVFSAGAHNISGAIANFSSRGPVTVDGSNRPKPDITAPGLNVDSAWRDNTYKSLSGTSMSAPHVAGAAALIWSAEPALIGMVDLTEQILIKSATPVFANQCGEGAQPVAPNYTYGYGRLDALAALEMAQHRSTATVAVLDCDAAPLPGAQAMVTDQYTGYTYKQLADSSGAARFPVIFSRVLSDTYTIAGQAGSAQFPAVTMQLSSGNNATATLQADVCNQPASLMVKVIDADNLPVGNAQIFLTDQATGNRYNAMADSEGQVWFANVYAGEYTMQLIGGIYGVKKTSVILTPGEAKEIVQLLGYKLHLPLIVRE